MPQPQNWMKFRYFYYEKYAIILYKNNWETVLLTTSGPEEFKYELDAED